MKKILKKLQQYENTYCINCLWYNNDCPGPLSRATISIKSKQAFWSEPDCPRGFPNGFYFYKKPQYNIQNTKCNKCVWQYNGCPGPTTSGCGGPYQYKRDPPDGGYYG